MVNNKLKGAEPMNTKLIHAGVALLGAGAVGIIFAVAMEIVLHEPIYFTIMKVTALLFGLGGSLIGLGSLRASKEHRKK